MRAELNFDDMTANLRLGAKVQLTEAELMDKKVCPRCNGQGIVPENRGKRNAPVQYMKKCPKCDPQLILRRKKAASRKKGVHVEYGS